VGGRYWLQHSVHRVPLQESFPSARAI
jgi:hypothetical protein